MAPAYVSAETGFAVCYHPKLTICQILFHSVEKNYVLTNLPWLIGSLGTMIEDAIIFVQFHAFGDAGSQQRDAAIVDGEE